jgi:hypothetical protein
MRNHARISFCRGGLRWFRLLRRQPWTKPSSPPFAGAVFTAAFLAAAFWATTGFGFAAAAFFAAQRFFVAAMILFKPSSRTLCNVSFRCVTHSPRPEGGHNLTAAHFKRREDTLESCPAQCMK